MIKTFLAVSMAFFCAIANAAPILESSRFNDGNAVDADPVGVRVPLILIHGLGGSGQGWEHFLKAYAANPSWRAAFKPYTFRYANNSADVAADASSPKTIKALGASLRDSIQAQYDAPLAAPHFGFGRKSIVLMAHSMGGLVARSMMQEHSFRDGRQGGERVLHLVTLGTPHHGSPMADAAFALGLQYSEEFRDTYLGFVAGMAWTNHDLQNMSHGVCNPWLAALNNYWPSVPVGLGACGVVPAIAKRGFYERIVAYGARTLQQPDLPFAFGTLKPGSAPALLAPYAYMRNSLGGAYANDGVVPYESAQFQGRGIWSRREAYACDHRYLERGYPVVMKSLQGSANGWAFCSGTVDAGTAMSSSIHGIAGGIVERIRAVSETERIMDWGEYEYAGLLQPAGAITDVEQGYHYRRYGSGALVGVKDGAVYFRGPSSNHEVVFIGTVPQMLARARAAGY